MKANNDAQIASIEKESVFGIVPILTREKQYRFSDAFFFLASYGIATWNYTQGAYIATLCSFKQLMITTMVGSLLVMLIFELPAILSTRYGIDIWIWMKAVLGHTGVKIVTIMVSSGATKTKSMAFSLENATTFSISIAEIFTHSASKAIPPLPGAQ